MEFMPMHLNRRFDDEIGCCRIHALSAHRGAKKKCVRVWHDLQEELKVTVSFFIEVTRGDESWCYGYNPESKQQSSQWKSPNLPRP
jgi:hypothetical protein